MIRQLLAENFVNSGYPVGDGQSAGDQLKEFTVDPYGRVLMNIDQYLAVIQVAHQVIRIHWREVFPPAVSGNAFRAYLMHHIAFVLAIFGSHIDGIDPSLFTVVAVEIRVPAGGQPYHAGRRRPNRSKDFVIFGQYVLDTWSAPEIIRPVADFRLG